MNIIPKWWIQRGQRHRSKVQAPQKREARQSFWVWPEGAPFWGSQWKRSQDCWETRLPSQVPGRAGMRTRDGICLSFSSHFSNPDRLPSSLGPGVQPGPSTGLFLLYPLLELVSPWLSSPSVVFTSTVQVRGNSSQMKSVWERNF